jgi:hypothetical protein
MNQESAASARDFDAHLARIKSSDDLGKLRGQLGKRRMARVLDARASMVRSRAACPDFAIVSGVTTSIGTMLPKYAVRTLAGKLRM